MMLYKNTKVKLRFPEGNIDYFDIVARVLQGHTLSPYLFIIFNNPSARAGYDTRSIFKRSLIGLNSEFFFSLTSCLTKAEEPVYPTIDPLLEGE